jgi:hypothetical protein
MPLEMDNATVKCMMKAHHDFRQMMMPPNIWGAFHALELDFDRRK